MKTQTKQRPPFYITTTLPYVNAKPHLGFAMELIRADVLARYKRACGYDVFFNTGTDEHGVKVYEKAREQGQSPQAYVDTMVTAFTDLCRTLAVSDDVHFIRTTDAAHEAAAQAFWRRCRENGYIYKQFYTVKYCKGCELEKTDSELEQGRCPLHPGTELLHIEEENYFFMFSEFAEKLLVYYQENKDFVRPDFRLHEITTFIERGLRDFSISRVAEKMPWGVPVPDDPEQVMSVWFDALVNYISTLGWPDDTETFERFWREGTTVQYAGKDNLRPQAAMWQAMLLAAGLPPTDQVVINGFITVGGKKMSKSEGTVIDPVALVEQYGSEAVRYFVTRHLHPFDDGDFTYEKFEEVHDAHLANGLGNLSARVLKMASQYFSGTVDPETTDSVPITYTVSGVAEEMTITGKTIPQVVADEIAPAYTAHMDEYRFDQALDVVWRLMSVLDRYVTDTEPFRVVKDDPERAKVIIWNLVYGLHHITEYIAPVLPQTAATLREHITECESGAFSVTALEQPLFPRLS